MTIIELPPSSLGHGKKNQGSLFQTLRWLVMGTPISSQKNEETLVRKLIALPVFCSDAISSVAYGGQQILLALCAAGLWMPQHHVMYGHYTMWISCLIAGLLVVVAASYWQTIFTYTNGGGSYIVTKDNLGTTPGLVAAAALLIDYVLTVSVSVASGLQNLEDVPFLASLHIGQHLVGYCVLTIFFITFINLRGLKESGALLATPTYVFIGMCYLMILLGWIGPLIGWHFHPEYVNQTVPANYGASQAVGVFSIFVLLRAFANGCSAMTGTEAVANGIPAFTEPKSKNAGITLVWMAVILGTIFMGVSWLAVNFHVVYWEQGGSTSPAVIDQISAMVFGKVGPWSWGYNVTQMFTALILIVAAQTSFADFPRLASILARDRFLPRQLTNLGDRLAFNNGIMLLGIFSSIILIMEKGSVDLLIPFFAIGVFIAFTCSQAGMVHHWFKDKGTGWQRKALVNGMGALACFVVVIDIAAEKFLEGAWLVLVIILMLLFVFKRIYRHYSELSHELNVTNYKAPTIPMQNTVIVLVHGVSVGTLQALDYARSISADCLGIYVDTEPEFTAQREELWNKYVPDIPLVVLPSPYRSLIGPILTYLDTVLKERPNHRITIIVSEFVPEHWWQSLLHGNTGLLLKLALLNRRDVVVANVRYWLGEHPPEPSSTQAV